MTYSHEQLKAMCPLSISECSQKHVQSVVAELIETALAQPATMFNGLTEAETGATASVFGLVGAQPASVPAGWKLVPVEPTLAMLDALRADTTPYLPDRYRAMLAAAPQAPQPAQAEILTRDEARRYCAAGFQEWLDDAVSDGGLTVFDMLTSVHDAYSGFQAAGSYAPQPAQADMKLVAIELERIASEPPISGNHLAKARVLLTAESLRGGSTRAFLAQPASTKERWNIERDGNALLVCFNSHEKGEACRYERFVPEAQPASVPAEPNVGHSALAGLILTHLGYSTSPSLEPCADGRRDRLAEKLAGWLAAAPAAPQPAQAEEAAAPAPDGNELIRPIDECYGDCPTNPVTCHNPCRFEGRYRPSRVHELLAALTVNDNPTTRARLAIELRTLLKATASPAVGAPQPEAQPSFDDWAADQADLMSESNSWARDRITGEFVYSTMRVAERAWKAATAATSAQAEPPGKNWHAHHVAVNKAALQMIRNALRTDAEAGKKSRAEMLEELDKATFAIPNQAEQGGK